MMIDSMAMTSCGNSLGQLHCACSEPQVFVNDCALRHVPQ
jgi:hypothetical protein